MASRQWHKRPAYDPKPRPQGALFCGKSVQERDSSRLRRGKAIMSGTLMPLPADSIQNEVALGAVLSSSPVVFAVTVGDVGGQVMSNQSPFQAFWVL